MRINLIGWTVLDVDHAAVRFPARDTRGVVIVRVRNTPVVLFFVLVLLGIGSRIASQPEVLDEGLPLFIGLQPLESLLLLIRDDVDDILVHPLLPGPGELLFELLLLLSDLFLGKGFRYGFRGTA